MERSERETSPKIKHLFVKNLKLSDLTLQGTWFSPDKKENRAQNKRFVPEIPHIWLHWEKSSTRSLCGTKRWPKKGTSQT